MTLEEEFSLLLDCGVTLLEEDFALLLDFAELLLESSLRELEELVAISLLLLDTLVSLSLDFGVTLEDDFALLLDFGVTLEDDDCAELLDFAELLDTDEEDFALLLDFALELDFALTEEEDLAELLDTLVSSSLDCGVTSSILLDDSSSRGAKLLSSSQAAKNARANPSKKRFIQKILLRYVVYLANFPSSLHPVFIIFPAKRIEHDD